MGWMEDRTWKGGKRGGKGREKGVGQMREKCGIRSGRGVKRKRVGEGEGLQLMIWWKVRRGRRTMKWVKDKEGERNREEEIGIGGEKGKDWEEVEEEGA